MTDELPLEPAADPPKQRKPRPTLKAAREALVKASGNAYAAARLCGCPAATMRALIKRHPSLRTLQAECTEDFRDLWELGIRRRVAAADGRVLCWVGDRLVVGKRPGWEPPSSITRLAADDGQGGVIGVVDLMRLAMQLENPQPLPSRVQPDRLPPVQPGEVEAPDPTPEEMARLRDEVE